MLNMIGTPKRSGAISSQTFSSLRQTGMNPSARVASSITSANGLGAAESTAGLEAAALGALAPLAGDAAAASVGARGSLAACGAAGAMLAPGGAAHPARKHNTATAAGRSGWAAGCDIGAVADGLKTSLGIGAGALEGSLCR